MSPETAHFSSLDWLVVLLVLSGMLVIGYFSDRSNKNQKDYILGGGKMKSSLVGISFFATMFSTLSYLSYPGEMIKYGPLFCAGILSFPFAGWIVSRFVIPKIMQLNVSSAYEILQMKLGTLTRNLAVVFFLSLRFMWMATIVYATVNTALKPLLGLSDQVIPYVCMALVMVTVVYTTMGGIKAVVWTDVFQSFIMFSGAILTIFIVLKASKGNSSFFDGSMCSHWLKWDWLPRMNTRMTAANIFIMNGLWQICTASSDQMAIQRYFAVGNRKKAGHTFFISLTSSAVIQLLLALVGFMVMAYFTAFPEQMAPGSTISGDADLLFPRFILIGLPAGLTGLIGAAIMAAAMSSLSSGLNSSATVIQEDILKRVRGEHREYSLRTIKLISLSLGLAVALASVLVGYVQGNLFEVVVKVVNLVTAPLFVLFFMALFVPFATDRGTFAGGLLALVVAILIAFFAIFGISPLWVMPVSLVVGISSATLFCWLDTRINKTK